MNPRKRQASEPLLPLRSAKQPRTTLEGYSGGNPSPSQHEGTLSRWLSSAKQILDSGCDIFFNFFKVSLSGLATSELLPVSHPHLPIPHPPPHPGFPPQPQIPVSLQRSMAPTPSPSRPPPATPRVMPPQAPPPPPLPSSHPFPTQMNTNDISPPSTTVMSASVTSGPSSLYIRSPYPRIDEAFAARRCPNDGVGQGVGRKYKNRDHIYAKTHKEQLKAVREKDREEMQKELYNFRRTSGYMSDFSTFKTYLSYRARLEMLERREALSPSPSLTDLRSKPLAPARSRRHSSSDDVNTAFLERALEKARETLNGPKPPRPFIPSFDQLRLSDRAKDEEIEYRLRGPKRIPPPSSLPPEDEAKVDAILTKRGVVSKFAREQVTDQDLSRLRPCQWLNDEIINFYGAMILARSDGCKENPSVNSDTKKPLNIHYFSTFFWSKLKGEGYEKARLAKWTKKLDIFQKDVVLIPINHNNSHWSGAAINFRQKRVESYDSMGMERENVFKLLRLYLDAEHRNKKKKPFDFTGWEDYTLEDTPQQENGYDCGVFTCQFLEALSRGEETFNFSQKNMPYLRRLMIWEIGSATLRGNS